MGVGCFVDADAEQWAGAVVGAGDDLGADLLDGPPRQDFLVAGGRVGFIERWEPDRGGERWHTASGGLGFCGPGVVAHGLWRLVEGDSVLVLT